MEDFCEGSKINLLLYPKHSDTFISICGPMSYVKYIFYRKDDRRKLIYHMGTIKQFYQDFPAGTVVKNPPANAGDMGSSPGPGRLHMPRSK